jgi:hypothetical protein
VAERKITFLLTLEEWWDVWQRSGHWHEHGRQKDQYFMARIDDAGPYATWNVRICKGKNERRHSPETRAKMRASQLGHPGWNRGRKFGPLSAEARAKISVALRDRPKTPEHRAAISAARVAKSAALRDRSLTRGPAPDADAPLNP